MWFVKFYTGGNFRRLELWLCSGSGWHLTNHQTVSTPSQFQRVNSGVDAVGLLSLFILIVSILRLFHLKMKTWLAYFRTFPIHLGSPWAFPEDPNKHLHQLLQMLYSRNGSWTLLKSLEISNKHLFSHMIISSVSTSHNFVVLKFIQWKNASSGRRATLYNWRLRYKEFCSWGQVCSFKMESLFGDRKCRFRDIAIRAIYVKSPQMTQIIPCLFEWFFVCLICLELFYRLKWLKLSLQPLPPK